MKFFDLVKNLFAKKPKKLGLALGSGGAKGMALLGALKAFEENGIKFDMVAGTSIGSIVGGFYANGYSTREIFDYLEQLDITNPTKLIMLKLKGLTVESILDGILGGIDIEDLSLPYWAIACDINSGEEVVMSKGSLANAMAASSAIPPVFKPVARNNRKLIDGAFVNSVPANVLKDNGADYVIAVSLTESIKNTASVDILDKMYKGHGVKEADRLAKGLSGADFIIQPDLSKYTALSIGNLHEMYDVGYNATIAVMEDVLCALEKNKLISKRKKK